MVMLEFAMSPRDKGEELVEYVARLLDIIDKSGVPYRLTPMGTILEGEWREVMDVVEACFHELEKDCRRNEQTSDLLGQSRSHRSAVSSLRADESREHRPGYLPREIWLRTVRT